MKPEELQEIRAILPKGRTPFYYFKDRYDLELVSYCLGEDGVPLRELRASRFGKLLDKPVFQPAIAELVDGILTAEQLVHAWPKSGRTYRLSLDQWPRHSGDYRWDQISRPGVNLVLQLNFCEQHLRICRDLLKESSDMFEGWGHPVSRRRPETMSWARLDIDIDLGIALIEEIQTDWLRDAKYESDYVRSRQRTMTKTQFLKWFRTCYGDGIRARDLYKYVEDGLAPYRRNWDEATLWAAIWFLREEIGIRTIFYNTWETGTRIKHIGCGNPPRSLYTQLPRKFCFEVTDEPPVFLRKKWARRFRTSKIPYRWYRLVL